MKISLGLFLTLTFLFSEKISEVDYKGAQKPLRIVVQRFSPAFAALEDTFISKSTNSKLEIQNITKSFDEQVVYIKSGIENVQIVKLDGLRISKSEKTAKTDAATLVSITKKVALGARSVLDKTFSTQLDLSSSNSSIEDLQEGLKTNLAMNSDLDQQSDALETSTHIQASAESLGESVDVDGATFVIGNPDAKSKANNHQQSLPLLGSNGVQDIGQMLTQGLVGNLKTGFGVLQQNMGPISLSTKNQNVNSGISGSITKPVYRQIKGQIILADGAVYPGDRFQFYIQRILGGITQERGLINPSSGEFDISVSSLAGSLKVELRHDSGALIAFGDLKLNANTLIDNPETLITVKPSDNAHFIGQALSYESFEEFEVALNGRSSGLKNSDKAEVYIDGDQDVGNADSNGKFSVSSLAAGSQMIVSASHKGYWNSLQIAEAGHPLKTILHSDKHMKSFLSLIEPYLKNSKINSVIWGRVLDRGLPVENVKVNLHGFEDLQPLYFSYRIPDPNLESTSGDGFFAFINPPEGIHIIKTDRTDLPLETTVVRLDHTSIVHVESAPKKNVMIHSFDAFNPGLQVTSQIAVPGMKSNWKVGLNKSSQVPFFDTSTNMVMDVNPSDSEYISTRYFIGRRRSIVNLPNFKRSWVSSLLSSQRVNLVPSTTSVIGWVENGNYEVQIYPSLQNTRIIYFDKLGNPTDKIIDGGGYFATNVPNGVVTSTLKNLKTGLEIKRLSVAEPDKVSVNYISDLSY